MAICSASPLSASMEKNFPSEDSTSATTALAVSSDANQVNEIVSKGASKGDEIFLPGRRPAVGWQRAGLESVGHREMRGVSTAEGGRDLVDDPVFHLASTLWADRFQRPRHEPAPDHPVVRERSDPAPVPGACYGR